MLINPKRGGNDHEPLNHALNAGATTIEKGLDGMEEWINRRNEIRADMEVLRANWTETRNPYTEDTPAGFVFGFWCAECFVETYGTEATVADSYRAFCGSCGLNYHNCDDCGTVEHIDNIETFDGWGYCGSCAQEHYPECTHCETQTHPDEFVFERDELRVCVVCQNSYTECARCHDVVNAGDTSEVYGELGRSYRWCDDCCSHYAVRCDYCNDLSREQNTYHSPSGDSSICDHCRDTGEHCICEGCGEITHECYGDDYGCACAECGSRNNGEVFSDCRDVTSRVVEGTTRDAGQRTFGVEVETEFPGEYCPFPIGGYHSDYAASNEFFGGWRAEEDCTVDAEFISPVLSGAAGMAEVIHTYRTLQDAGAVMTQNAGQHITVDVGNYDAQVNVQSLMFVLEDALIALTGSYSRLHSTMCRRVKKESTDPRVGAVRGKFVAAGLKGGTSLVEFRYPPGTLSPEQLAINVGLTQLIAHLANTMPKDIIDGLVERALELETDNYARYCDDRALDEQQRMQAHIMHGLEVLAGFGWYSSGVMHGLPYDPDNAPIIELVDHDRDHALTIELPDRTAIFDRMHRQLSRFYRKAGLEFTHASGEALARIDTSAGHQFEYVADAPPEPEVEPEVEPGPPTYRYDWQDSRFPIDAWPGRYAFIDDDMYVYVGGGQWVWRHTTNGPAAALLRSIGLVPVGSDQYLTRQSR